MKLLMLIFLFNLINFLQMKIFVFLNFYIVIDIYLDGQFIFKYVGFVFFDNYDFIKKVQLWIVSVEFGQLIIEVNLYKGQFFVFIKQKLSGLKGISVNVYNFVFVVDYKYKLLNFNRIIRRVL